MGCSSSTAEALFTAEEPIDSADDDKDILKKYLTAALAKNSITKSIMESWVSDETDKFLSLGKLMVLKPNAGCVDHTNMLIERGQNGEGLFVIYSGSFKLDDGLGTEIPDLQTGESIGERCLLVNTTMPHTVVAAEPSRVYLFTKDDFKRVRDMAIRRQNGGAETDADRRGSADSQRRASADAQRRASGDPQRRPSGDPERRKSGDGDPASPKRASAEGGKRGSAEGGKRGSAEGGKRGSGEGGKRGSAEGRRQSGDGRRPSGDKRRRSGDGDGKDGFNSNIISQTPLASLSTPLPANYVRMRAKEKQELLWTRLSTTPYDAEKMPNDIDPNAALALMNPYNLAQTFATESDEVVDGRKKVFNTYGAAAKVNFIITKSFHQYTGLFKTGAPGIMRFSLASPVLSESDPFCPGVALKLLVDYQSSVNLFGVNYLASTKPKSSGKVNSNFFAYEMSTSQGLPHQYQVPIFFLPSSYPFNTMESIPCNQASQVQVTGESVQSSTIVTPSKVIFTPAVEVVDIINSKDRRDFRTTLSSIPVGTVLYNVSAYLTDKSQPDPLGVIILESPIVASKYVDEHLFFQHPFDLFHMLCGTVGPSNNMYSKSTVVAP